jgi:hypothetical protein
MAAVTPIDKLPSTDKNKYLNEDNHHEDEDKIIQEFNHLLEKSKHLFNGLR